MTTKIDMSRLTGQLGLAVRRAAAAVKAPPGVGVCGNRHDVSLCQISSSI